MNDTLEARAFAIYDRSLDMDDTTAESYVTATCGEDAELLARVQQLRQASENAIKAGFLDNPYLVNLGSVAAGLKPTSFVGKQLGCYHLVRELGVGGFGKVYLAEQQEPVKRMVAVKILRGSLCDDTFLRRFEGERQVLALLSHPNIAQIFDAATTDEGDPYFAMEYVPGVPITQYCDERRLSISDRLTLFVRVCSAIQHAHQKGIIHRDIKPANILIAEIDDVAQPKIIDFGIAKVLDLDFESFTLETQAGGLLGSPAYMSPEQVSQSRVAIDTRSDIYALGVLLYELLTGRTPFQFKNTSLVDTLNRVLQSDPVPPSQQVKKQQLKDVARLRNMPSSVALARALNSDVDAIVLKALSKNPERRYASATHLGTDIQRYLEHEPVSAAPLTVRYRAGKFVRRHKLAVLSVFALTLTLIAGLAGTVGGLVRAKQAEAAASQAARNAQRTITLMQDFLAAPDPREQGPDLRVVDMLGSFEPRLSALVDQPAIHGSLLQTYGITHRSLGMPAEALKFAQQSAEIRQQHLGRQHPDTLGSIHLAAQLTGELGNHREAEASLLQLRSDARALGSNPAFVMDVDNSLARIAYLSGDHERAKVAYIEVVESRTGLLGSHHMDTLRSMAGLSLAYSTLGEKDSAIDVAREVLEIQTTSLGSDHPETLEAQSALAFALGEAGRYSDALSMHEAVLQSRTSIIGPRHRKTLASRMNVAWLMGRLGRHEEAQVFNEDTLTLQREALGVAHPDVYTTLSNIATNLNALGKTDDAEPLMLEVIAGRVALVGEKHSSTLTAKNDLMVLYARQERFAEAEDLIREVLQGRMETVGDDHPGTLTAMNNLTWLLSQRGAWQEAEELGRQVVTKRSKLFGADHPSSLSAKSNLAATLNRAGKPAEALPLIHEVWDTRKQVLGESHVDTLTAAISHAEILYETGAGAQAKEILQKSVIALEQALGKDHRKVTAARQLLDKWRGEAPAPPGRR